ncbi:unnamed protein product [Clavelina lepadiformis]|uniref:Uncharacterized protein n=1 Tax=Clavelina lepadiformis TaxID=159417 RepID=A0ABP0GB88_CLALP
MNFARILTKCGSFQRTPLVLRSMKASRDAVQRNSTTLVPRRLLMSSVETGGIKPFKAPKRIGIQLKVPAAILLFGSLYEWYWWTVNEDRINNFLGTEWNTSLVFGFLECVVGPVLAYITFCATLPF